MISSPLAYTVRPSMRQVRSRLARLGWAVLLVMAGVGAAEAKPAIVSNPVESAIYRLGSGDQLKINVYNADKITGTYIINGAGTVDLPLVGALPAAGKTIRELEQEITGALKNGYINDPSVVVDVTNYRPYYILGEINKPGEFSYVDGLSAFSAVARAGGFTYRANTRRIYIRHKADRTEVLYRLDGSTPVNPGDTLRIPDRTF